MRCLRLDRLVVLGTVSLLALACGDDAGGAGTLAQAGSGGNPSPSGGGSAAGSGGSVAGSGGIASGGSLAGGGITSGGAAGSGGGGGSGGRKVIDPNGGAPTGPSKTRHTPKPKGSVPETIQAYWEYVPPHYGNGALYPLLVFWHGVGENGDGSLNALQNVLKNGPPKLIDDSTWPEARPFVVLSPQHAPSQQAGRDCPTSQEIDEFLQFALDNYELDSKRVYLTGLSCGAIGSWNYLGDHTNETVAAAALVCGDGKAAFAKAGCALAPLPIWALHGGDDGTVLPEGSEVPINGLQACATLPADAKLTIYPGVGHDSWSQTYDLSAGHDIYTWLMSHSKP